MLGILLGLAGSSCQSSGPQPAFEALQYGMSLEQIAPQHPGVEAEVEPDTHGNWFHRYECDLCGAGGHCQYRLRHDKLFELVVVQSLEKTRDDPVRIWRAVWSRATGLRDGSHLLYLRRYPGPDGPFIDVSRETPMETGRDSPDTPLPSEIEEWEGSPLESGNRTLQATVVTGEKNPTTVTVSLRAQEGVPHLRLTDLRIGPEGSQGDLELPDWRTVIRDACR